MGYPSDPEKQVAWILQQVKEVSETDRNLDWGDNKRASGKGKVCLAAAAPKDLGATKTDQQLTKMMYRLADEGYLERAPYRRSTFPYFKLSDKGKQYLSALAEKSAAK